MIIRAHWEISSVEMRVYGEWCTGGTSERNEMYASRIRHRTDNESKDGNSHRVSPMRKGTDSSLWRTERDFVSASMKSCVSTH